MALKCPLVFVVARFYNTLFFQTLSFKIIVVAFTRSKKFQTDRKNETTTRMTRKKSLIMPLGIFFLQKRLKFFFVSIMKKGKKYDQKKVAQFLTAVSKSFSFVVEPKTKTEKMTRTNDWRFPKNGRRKNGMQLLFFYIFVRYIQFKCRFCTK